MANDDANADAPGLGYDFIKRVQEFDVSGSQLMRNIDAAGLTSCVVAVQSAVRAAREMTPAISGELQTMDLNSLVAQAIQLLEIIDNLKKLPFTPAEVHSPHVKASLFQLQAVASTFAAECSRVGQFEKRRLNAKLAELDQAVQRAIANEKKNLEALLELESAKREQKVLVESIREPAIRSAAQKNASHLLEQSERHKQMSIAWASAGGCVAVLLVSFAIMCLALPLLDVVLFNSRLSSRLSTATNIHLGFGKVLVFSSLAYLLFFCKRNYSAERHNRIVNAHRANALMTYEVLVASASEASKDVLLNHAAECIFGPQPTGFTKHESNDTPTVALLQSLSSAATKSQHSPPTL